MTKKRRTTARRSRGTDARITSAAGAPWCASSCPVGVPVSASSVKANERARCVTAHVHNTRAARPSARAAARPVPGGAACMLVRRPSGLSCVLRCERGASRSLVHASACVCARGRGRTPRQGQWDPPRGPLKLRVVAAWCPPGALARHGACDARAHHRTHLKSLRGQGTSRYALGARLVGVDAEEAACARISPRRRRQLLRLLASCVLFYHVQVRAAEASRQDVPRSSRINLGGVPARKV